MSLVLIVFGMGSGPGLSASGVVDDSGYRIDPDQPLKRIVSLAPHVTEMLFAIGAGESIVGVVDYSDYPAQAKSLPRVGGYERVDLEALLALRPDLVVAWSSGNGAVQLQRLRQLGLKVYETEPRSLQGVYDTMARLAILIGTSERPVVRARLAAFDRQLKTLHQEYAAREKVKVFYQIWPQPLMTINGDHLISDVIRVCGGQNIFHDVSSLVPSVSIEAVLRHDPDAIIASGMDQARPQWLQPWHRWPHLTAVKHRHLYFIDPDLIQRQGPRILQGAQQMCEVLEKVRKNRP